jgi:hypothetical protein
MKQQTAQLAAKWWADKLRKPEHTVHDNGTGNIFASFMGKSRQTRHTAEEVNRFETILASYLSDEDYMSIATDYRPDDILWAAASEAGFELGDCDLPWKTGMIIDKETVSVRDGYQANWIKLN